MTLHQAYRVDPRRLSTNGVVIRHAHHCPECDRQRRRTPHAWLRLAEGLIFAALTLLALVASQLPTGGAQP